MGSTTGTPPKCPLTIAGVCGTTTITSLPAYFPGGTATTLTFKATDFTTGVPVGGVPIDFTQSNPSLGTLSTTTGKTGADGKVTVNFTPNSTIGNTTVTAMGTCADANYVKKQDGGTIVVKVSKVNIAYTNDCLATASAYVSNPFSNYTLQVQDSGGVVPNVDLDLSLSLPTDFLPPSPNYSQYEAELFVSGTSRGTTDSSGSFTPYRASTGGSGVLSGKVQLNRDTPGNGLQVKLEARPVATGCATGTGTATGGVTFYKLILDSETPTTGCSEVSACTIPAGSTAPSVAATLTLKGTAVQNAPVTFAKTDVHYGSPPGHSILIPSTPVSTDASGKARAFVANDGAAGITSGTPLQTTVGATSTGDPSLCSTGSIALASLRSSFNFQGYAAGCSALVQDSFVKKSANDTLCLDVKNDMPTGGCPLLPTGISVKLYKSDGTADSTIKIETIEGGAIYPTAQSCDTTGKKVLFVKDCNGGSTLNNGQRWNFVNYSNKCYIPTATDAAGSFFVFNKIKFSANVTGLGKKAEVTVYYTCQGSCPSSVAVQKTFTVNVP